MKNVLFLLILLTSFPAFTQELQGNRKLKHSVGAGAGFTTGVGLSYRYTPDKYAIQLNFAPVSNEYRKFISAGVSFLYYLVDNEKTRFYLYQGNHFLYREFPSYTYYSEQIGPEPYDYYTYYTMTQEVQRYWSNGVGFGFELILGDRISTNLMTGYAAYRNFTRFSLTGEVALYYKL
jgi:hypothetical protein